MLFIEQIVHFSAHQSHNSAVDDLGTGAEGLAHLSGTLGGVHVDGGFEDHLVLLLDDDRDVMGMIGQSLGGAVNRDLAAAKIEILQCGTHAFIKKHGEDIAFEMLGNDAALGRDRLELVPEFVLAVDSDQIGIQHFMKGFREIQIHHVVGLHHDLVDRHKVERIIDVSHQIQHEDLDVVFASDR